MKWRCTWCGKPHEENDPPCDSCGHNKFEQAIVRQGADEPGDDSTGTVDTGTTYVWRCQDCGRDHVKNTPPCARCGNHDLEKIEQNYDDIDRELETPSWFEVAKPYTPIIVGFAVIVALFATGIVSLSMVPGVGPPSPPDAPGEGSEAAGIDLEATEAVVHERLEAERDVSRSYDSGLAAFAEYENRAGVASNYDDASADDAERDDFDLDCSGRTVYWNGFSLSSIDDYDDEDELAAAVVDSIGFWAGESPSDGEFHAEGLDLHVVEGTVYGTYAVC